jgi:hypothetical protein
VGLADHGWTGTSLMGGLLGLLTLAMVLGSQPAARSAIN